MRLTSVVLALSTSALALSTPLWASEPLGGAARGTLEAALETISIDEIRSDIYFIASDDLEGRDTVSPGQRIAARYIRARLERLGVEPGAPTGYFAEYPLYTSRLREKESHARFTRGENKVEWALGRDYFFAASAPRDVALEGAAVFGGECEKRALAKVDVTGKWVVALDDGGLIGDVEGDLLERGALGLVLFPADKFDGKPYAEKYARQIMAYQRGGARWPSKEAESEPKPMLPVLYVQRAALAQAWPEAAGKDGDLPKPGKLLEGSFSHRRAFQGNGGRVMAENVCGWWPGSDPVLKNEVILISAHYDHVGYSGGSEIHNGADDNGSGTTGLLALAEALSVRGPLRRSVMLLWVSGEEKGLYGSQAWTENPWLPDGAKPLCNINIDMIGRNAPDKLLITPTQKRSEYNGLVRLAEKVAPLEGFPTLGSCDAYWGRSDHANFAKNLKIPVCFLFSDVHEDYHKPSDDPDKIDYDKIRRVARTVLRVIEGLQDDKLDL